MSPARTYSEGKVTLFVAVSNALKGNFCWHFSPTTNIDEVINFLKVVDSNLKHPESVKPLVILDN